MPSNNRAWQIASPGKLVHADAGPCPSPGQHQVLVRIRAVSLNYRDLLCLDHSPNYPIKHKADLVPCLDGAGEIEAVGEGSQWKVGDRVIIQPNTWLTGTDPRSFKLNETIGAGEIDGTLQQYMVRDDSRVFKAPDRMTFEEACTLYTAGVTAWYSLNYGAPKLQAGGSILTQGTGGVSCYAIQIAAAVGATVVATSSSDEKLEIAKKLGAKHLINYRKTPDWSAEVLKATNGEGVDMVVEVVGGAGLLDSVKAARFGGRISVIGILSGDDTPVALTQPLLYGAKTLQACFGAGSKEMAIELSTFAEKHQLHPPIAQVFEFEEADKAMEALRTLSGVGKIVIRV
ncbi:hypothetical protein LTR95_009606 [Oleoguttula sp. CCFEE 5521]